MAFSPNIVILYPSGGLYPEGWSLYTRWVDGGLEYVHGTCVSGSVPVRYHILRAPAGTPIPAEGRLVHRKTLERNPSAVNGVVDFTPAELDTIVAYRDWLIAMWRAETECRRKGSIKSYPDFASKWEAENPAPRPVPSTPLRQLMARGVGWEASWDASDDPSNPVEVLSLTPLPTQATVLREGVVMDPWVTPAELSLERVTELATALPGSPLTVIVLREPPPVGSKGHWTVARGIGGLTIHLGGGWKTKAEARVVGLLALLEAREAAVAQLRADRGYGDGRPEWGISWKTYLETVTVVTAAHKQNGWNAYRGPACVEKLKVLS